jgi:L-serine/L-threonine ammonia-lyase
MALHIETPQYRSLQLSNDNRNVWIKMEALQPPGSFKIRGIGAACTAYAAKGATRFIAASGGNAGIAVAYAGQALSIPVLVVVPETTSATAIDLLRLNRAEVIVAGASFQEANTHARSLISASDAFLHPFDDPHLWHGHATMIDEVHRSGFEPDAVVLSVGGGGLLAGVAEGLKRNHWHDIPIIAVETAGAASLRAAITKGAITSLEKITTIASSLAAKRVCDEAFRVCQERPVMSAVVSDQSALAACEFFLRDHRILVEPACGASLSLAYENAPELKPFKNVLMIVCGGVTATLDQIRKWASSI